MENEQEQLKKLAQIFNTGNVITADQVKQVLTGIVAIMGSYKGDTEKLNSDTKKGIVRMVEKLKNDHADVLAECESKNKKLKESVDKAVEAVEKKLLSEADVTRISDKIISDKIAKDHESLVSDVLSKIQLPEQKEVILDGPVQIANKLETLQGADRLKASAIFGLEELIDERITLNFPNGRGGGAFRNTIGGGVTQIKAGTGVTIDSTGAGGRGVVTISASGGAISDGDKGDITVSGSGATWTIDNGAVTLAKMADMATASILGRNTAGSGVPEVLSAATTKSLLSLNNVENTALSTWAGTTNITTLGTISTGVWGGTAIPLNKGGTGTSLSDPGADTLMGWDDTDGAIKFITIGSNLSYDHATHTLSATGGAGTPTAITVADEAADTSCFVCFFTAATGDLGPKTNAGLTFNSATGVLTATGFAGPLTGNVTGNASGNAGTATALQTPRTIGGVSFDGTANIVPGTITVANEATDTTCFPLFVTAATGDLAPKSNANLTYNSNTGALASTSFVGDLTGNVTGNVSGSSGSTTGNAATATALQNARTIGGVSFDGTANITVATATGGFTVSGGNLALGTNSLSMTGSLAATGARVTKGWFTDIESTNMPTVGGVAILTSLTAPQFTTIELGHATANTLSASGGILSIEGTAIPTISSADTLSNKTLTAPKFANAGFIADANGNELIIFTTTASAVNEWTLANGGTGVNPKLTASGEANVGLDFQVKGTGVYNFYATTSGPTDMRLYEDADNGSNYASIIAPASMASNRVLTLPDATDTLVGKATTDVFTNKTLTASSNVLGGVTMTLGSDADGDIYYRSSGVLTRLAKGTGLQQLRMNAGATAPEWFTASAGGGGWVLVGNQAFSGSATATINANGSNLDGNNDEMYMLVVRCIISGGDRLVFRMNSATSSYLAALNSVDQGSSGGLDGSLTQIRVTANGNYTEHMFTVYISSKTAQNKIMHGTGFSTDGTNLKLYTIGGVWLDTSTAITSFTLLTSNGVQTFSSGSEYWIYKAA